MPESYEEIETILKKRLKCGSINKIEEYKFKTALMLSLGKEYFKRNWTMQIRYGVKRNSNEKLSKKLGSDAGGDCISGLRSPGLADFLNALAKTDEIMLWSVLLRDAFRMILRLVKCSKDAAGGLMIINRA